MEVTNIKQLQPKEGVTLLAWLLPDDFRDFAGFVRDHLYYWGKLHTRADYPYSVKLPFSDVEYLGISTEIPEEQTDHLMESAECNGTNLFWDYVNECWFDDSMGSLDSFNTFLEANEVYSVNPYGEKARTKFFALDGGTDYEFVKEQYLLWQQAEANTGTYVILMKQND